MLSLNQSVTQTGLQRLFLHKLQGEHMWSQISLTWDHEISLYPTPSWTARFTLKLIREIYFTGFPALFCLHGLTLLKLWGKLDLSQGPSCEACQLCQPPWGWQCPLGRDVVPGHANRCEAEDPGITGSVVQEQAAKPLGPHSSSGRKPGF